MTQADVVRYLSAAMNDGWEVVLDDLYTLKLAKDGFIMSTYKYNGKWCGVSIWDKNQKAVSIVNPEYDMNEIVERSKLCSFCASKEATNDVGFAYKSCDGCFHEALKKFEYKGWNS